MDPARRDRAQPPPFAGTDGPGNREEILSRFGDIVPKARRLPAARAERFAGNLPAAFAAHQEERIIRAHRVVLSSRMLGRLHHAQGEERRNRNAVMGAKSPEDFHNGLRWLHGGTGLTARAD